MKHLTNFGLNRTAMNLNLFLPISLPNLYTQFFVPFAMSTTRLNVLELLFYISVAYLFELKIFKFLLRFFRYSIKCPLQSAYARDRLAEAIQLYTSATICFILTCLELQPRLGVHRSNNSLTGVFLHNRLYDIDSGDAASHLGVARIVTAFLLHSAVLSWHSNRGTLKLMKQLTFLVFFVASHQLRFKYLGSATVFLASGLEVLLQSSRVICCFEVKRGSKDRLITTVVFSTYLCAWLIVFVYLVPWHILQYSLCTEVSQAHLPGMCILASSLWLFYCLEVATLPFLHLVRHGIWPATSPIRSGLWEAVLIPPPSYIVNELWELRARKLESMAASRTMSKKIIGNSENMNNLYKSLKMMMTVKKRIRRMRQARMQRPLLNQTMGDHHTILGPTHTL